jgi:MYND finger
MKRAGVLHLVACLIDVPDHDVYSGAIFMIQNYCANNGEEIKPNDFPDPDHFLRSVVIRIERLAEDAEMNHAASVLMSIAARMSNDHAWRPYFDRIAAQKVEHRLLIDHMIRRMAPSFGNMTDVDRDDQPSARHGPGTSGPTSTLGGRLAKCDACGKIEGKMGQLKSCGRCASTRYCDRDCQLKHWKIQKKQCAKLVLAASVKK